jgi:hypothetical protein
MLVALAATLTMTYAPAAIAADRLTESTPTLDGRGGLPQTIHFPATVRGKGAGTTTENMDFAISEFRRGRNGALCVVGTLRGGSGAHTVNDTVVSLPAGPKGANLNAGDCQMNEDDHGDREEHGALMRPGARVSPAVAAAELGLRAPMPYLGQPGGVIVPTQTICTVLDLILGPIHLDLLGLVVDTNRIHVTITADPTGGLLGSLLSGLLC